MAALSNNMWVFTEKVDGTNIRVIWDGYRVEFRGRTDAAQIAPHLKSHLEEKFGTPEAEQLFEQKFGDKPTVLYGEGYGGNIQNGKRYRPDSAFILFDVRVGRVFLNRENTGDLSHYFGVRWVPRAFAEVTLNDAIDRIREGQYSHLTLEPGEYAEGVVGTPVGGFLDRRGNRIIVKLKHADLFEG